MATDVARSMIEPAINDIDRRLRVYSTGSSVRLLSSAALSQR